MTKVRTLQARLEIMARTKSPQSEESLRELADMAADVADENNFLREACKEAFRFLTAPAGSPRLQPLSRGNLSRMLEDAIK